ncbi:class I SAM-dependent DNA methyltransferase [Acutalibacter intestini]|uniref:class I SAM-dependent DNA methyltransferase n=1 Tax=Acutalibacter intestini TaxID=3093659 RepID=UPI002AC8EB4C|nr:methyltransferase domain-containing protein [Acutalibacter sp. M00204]
MAGYSVFSQFYDELTANAEYPRRAAYFRQLLQKFGHPFGLTLDLACGTGSLTLELHRLGIDVYGVDASVEMLSIAREKCLEAGADILFLRQRMQDLDLFGTVNTIVCSLDSINHLQGKREVQRAFERAALFLEPGGYFVFDLNTLYKHEKILGNNTFIYDMERVFCAWQNHFVSSTGKVDIHLDFFQRDKNFYRRSSEHFSEYAYPVEQVVQWLHTVGFGDVQIYDELSFDPPKPQSQRLVFAAKKQE